MSVPDEGRQLRILYRDFLFRMVDLEVLSAHGDIRRLLGQFVAMLAAFSFVLAFLIVPRYASSTLPRQRLLIAAWGDQEFLIATTIGIVGLFAVIAWNTVLPDRRDSLVLGPLPVRTRTMFAARAAAIATALAVCVIAVNVLTELISPFFTTHSNAGFFDVLRSLGAYWATMLAAGLFVFCALLALQGIAAQLLSYRLFLRISGFLQLGALFVILAIYFLTPSLATVNGLTAPANQRLLACLPSFWFLGLFQQLNGSTHPVFGPLAARALWNLLLAFTIATTTYALAYYRHMHRIIEQPDIAPGDRSRRASRIAGFIARRLLPKPFERAIFLFTARTIARSRQHRFLLAVYGGAGLAIALTYSKSLLYGQSRAPWDQLNRPLLVGSLVLLSFAVIGVRAVFALPLALPANWIFRITAVHRPAAYFTAVRKSLLILTAVPVWMVSLILYFSIWPGRPALEHMLVLVAVGVLIVERSLYQLRKIPFACSYLPGGANLNVKLGIYAIVFLLAAEIGTQLEFWSMQKPVRFVVLFGILAAAAVLSRRRTLEYAASPHNRIQFEDLPPGEVFALDLRRDGEWCGDQAYVDAIDSDLNRPLRARLKPVGFGAILLATAGFLYEQAGEWRDHRRFPQVGRSVDIGGRSLNIYCSGDGSPTVILEGTHGAAGYSWVFIQRAIAKFTRACWYDRAGYGWSDPGPFPNHSDSIARDLHELVGGARIAPPYLLVGDQMGAFHVRVYRGFYPGEVAGMVLVDPFNEDTTIRIHNHIESLRAAVVWFSRTLGVFGWFRLLASDPGPPPRGLSPDEWAAVLTMSGQAKTIPARISEPPMWVSGELARAAGGFGNLPVTVLSSGKQSEDWYTETHEIKLGLHAELAGRSSRGRHVIVNNSQHEMLYEAPEAVIEAVRDIVEEVRAPKPIAFTRTAAR